MEPSTISDAAQTGFAAAALYDQHRPTYTDQAVEEFLKVLDIKNVGGARILDLAAGTGKFTEVLSQQPENFEITAVEPHKGMLEQLSNKKLRNVTIQEGSAENMSALADGSMAAVIVAQAFHWFSNMKALAEIHRVLQSAGVFGVIWNIEDYNAPLEWDIHPGWQTRMREVIWEFDDDQPRFRHQRWKEVFDEQNAGNPVTSDPLFGLPIGEKSFDQVVWLSKEDIWARYKTLSQIAILQGDELEKVEKIFWDAIDAEDTELDEQGRVAVNFRTHLAWTTKIPTAPLVSVG